MEDIKNFFDKTLITADGQTIKPKELNTRHVIINVASKCQYTDESYKDLKDFLNVIGPDKVTVWLYPSNDFGSQEPGSDNDIKDFCQSYGVLNYPNVYLMNKTVLKDSDLWHWLQYTNYGSTQNGYDFEAKWNFFKYLIDYDGNMWGLCYSEESLMSQEIIEWINTPYLSFEQRKEFLVEMIKNDEDIGIYDSEGVLIDFKSEDNEQ